MPTLGELYASPFWREAHHWYRGLHLHFRCCILDALWICNRIYRVSGFTHIKSDCDTSHIESLSHIDHDCRMKRDNNDSAVPVILAAITALLVCFALVLSYEAIHSAPGSDISSSNWCFWVLTRLDSNACIPKYVPLNSLRRIISWIWTFKLRMNGSKTANRQSKR